MRAKTTPSIVRNIPLKIATSIEVETALDIPSSFFEPKVVARDEDVRTYRDADEEVRHEPYQRRVRADGGERIVPREAAHDDDVRGVEEQLQNAREHYGNGEEQHFGHYAPAAHVDGVFAPAVFILVNRPGPSSEQQHFTRSR